MNYFEIALLPDLLEENRRELERELERKRQIREARAARLVEMPSRSATLMTRLRRVLQRDPRRPLAEGC